MIIVKHEKYAISGMSCSACSARVEKAAARLPGMKKASVNLLTNSMQVDYDEALLSSQDIITAVTNAGYGAAPAGAGKESFVADESAASAAASAIQELKNRLIGSVLFLLPTMYIASHGLFQHLFGLPVPHLVEAVFDGPRNAIAFAFAQFLLLLPIMYLNKKYYINGFHSLFQGAPNMDSLVAIGSSASAVFGIFAIFRMGWGLGYGDLGLVETYSTNLYFESAGMIVTLITVGKYLEARAKGKTSAAIEKLMDLAPKEATVLRDGKEVSIAIEELLIGDEIVIRPGESIPADGIISQGTTSIDESAITGESIPVEKQVGDAVTAATINKAGYIHVTAKRIGEDTTISQIIKLVDEASASKAPIAKTADTIAGIFVPAVIAIALITTAIWYFFVGTDPEFAFSVGIAVLVISCPCALGLATPVAIMVGTGKGAENGILIKSGEALEIAHRIDTVVMDKTGTITIGKPSVTDILPYGVTKETLLSLAAGLEKGSEHPLAEAVIAYSREQGITPTAISDFRAIFGRGVCGTSNGVTYYAGNRELMSEHKIDTTALKETLDRLSDQGKTPLIFAAGDKIIGIIAAADTEKETSAAAISRFKELGIKVVMLTGDNKRTAEAVRKRLHIPQVIAGVLPQDKEKHIADLQKQGHCVAMIGDGINDAPALMKADLGIAIGAGTDVAIESADAVLMRSDLLDAVSAVRLSKEVIKNIKENLFWAFIYNIIGIPLAAGLLYPAFGIKLSPVIGAAAMSLSSFCVCMNALRLRFFKAERAPHHVSRETLPAQSVVTSAPSEIPASPVHTTLTVRGMMCQHCVKQVTAALSEIAGVTAVNVSLERGEADVSSTIAIPTAVFSETLTAAGYTLQLPKEEQEMEKTIKIEGMMCQHCQQHVHDALSKIDGVTAVTVDLEGKKADIKADRDIPTDELAKVIADAGYELVK